LEVYGREAGVDVEVVRAGVGSVVDRVITPEGYVIGVAVYEAGLGVVPYCCAGVVHCDVGCLVQAECAQAVCFIGGYAEVDCCCVPIGVVCRVIDCYYYPVFVAQAEVFCVVAAVCSWGAGNHVGEVQDSVAESV